MTADLEFAVTAGHENQLFETMNNLPPLFLNLFCLKLVYLYKALFLYMEGYIHFSVAIWKYLLRGYS